MPVSSHTRIRLFRYCMLLLFVALCTVCQAAPPANDACSNAAIIPIPQNGFGLGNFTSIQANMTEATVETGENYAPAIFVAGLDKKSVWFKFSIPTIRAVRVTLTQPGIDIKAGDVGFTVYKTNKCVPGNADISDKLTPIVTFGNTYHPCVPSGDYLIQVSSNFAANGPVMIQLEISDQTGAAYDHPNQAYAFDTVRYYAQKIDFNTECQSIEDSSEICSAFANPYLYNKTAWLTFTTPLYFDYLLLQLSSANGSYFPSNNGAATKRIFGLNLYKGNVVSTPVSSLTSILGCDSVETDGYYAAYKLFRCDELERGTTYTIQVFIRETFTDDIRIGIMVGGQKKTNAPQPALSSIPAPNTIGNLAASPDGIRTYLTDVWGCNSRHNNNTCSPAMPDSGILYGGGRYNLSSFFTFTLADATAVSFNAYPNQCGPRPLLRLFKQGVTNDCTALDTANIILTTNQFTTLDCMEPGNYTLQVSGQDGPVWFGSYNTNVPLYNYEQCLSNNLGTSFVLDMTAYSRKAANKYSLAATGAFDTINRVGSLMAPLQPGVAHPSVSDTFGCRPTLMAADTTCHPNNERVIYRQFAIADSGVVDFSNLTQIWNNTYKYRVYSGDANALASAQNVFSYPDKINNLNPKTECFDGWMNCANKSLCVVPGTYTFTTMGSVGDVGRVDKPTFTLNYVKTKHSSPFTAQDLGSIMDTLGPNGGTIQTDADQWDCTDNAVPINGYQPCSINGRPATKAIYRQFYLKEPALVRIEYVYYWYCANRAFGYKTLFYGKATEGLDGLTPVGNNWNCFQWNAGTTAGCELLPAGWYTVVSYNHGPSYDSTMRGLNLEGRYNSAVSYYDEWRITITPTCKGPQYNRPYKASVNSSNQPHLVVPVNRAGHTAAYPRTDSTYVLPTENFNCIVDTPFSKHPVNACFNEANRVVYYVFTTTKECFLYIAAGGYHAALYDKDVRTDSLLFSSLKPLQPCTNANGYIQYCYFQPGTYTLVIFAGNNNICQSVTPSIYAEEIGYSRFDFAAKAYDFGIVPPDSAWHNGKVGDVNPFSSGRAPSADIFYCTTGADENNPTDPVCNTKINPNVYNTGANKPMYDSAYPPSNGATRRNLWYTFVADQPGTVRVQVNNKSDNKGYQPRFAVYKSDVDGTLPFGTVVSSGELDSTKIQGLELIGVNPIVYWPYYCFSTTNEVSFYRDPCSSTTNRYYILVENVNSEPNLPGGNLPNTMVEVSILIDSVNLIKPKFDHYYQAHDMGSVGVGKYSGEEDNYSCATRDATDPFYYYGYSNDCRKTLWYKFTPTITGNVRWRVFINGQNKYDYYNVQLFRQTIPGDSTSNGLAILGYYTVYDNVTNSYWAENCVSPGTYYLMVTGCGQVNEWVYPEIQLIEAIGDFCNRAVPAAIDGPGAATVSVLVNCHTIGSDYGEFGPTLTCPENAKTTDYKSSWFRMDIGGTDTLDVTTYLVENTNAASGDIKYRLMTGGCGAMQEQSCVLDALTQNTYQCLAPGQSYYVQVLTPLTKFNQAVTGTIDLKLSAVKHADTCAPIPNCLASANFLSLFDCTKDDSVKFVNYSTYGTSIKYTWHFGHNGATSGAVSPSYFYPALPNDAVYTVKLVVENTDCGKKDSVSRTISIPGRPYVNLGPDLLRCTGEQITFKVTSHPGATYLWQNGSTADSFTVTAAGNHEYRVKIDYNNCSSADTVKVVLSNLAPKAPQNLVLCSGDVTLNAYRGQGETYTWNNGSTAYYITTPTPGIFWADLNYFGCIYRDSFIVQNVNNARPLGNDTTVCVSGNGHILKATITGAQSYLWQDGSTADTLKVTLPGEYSVKINFGSCTINDTVSISGYPAPLEETRDTSICAGQIILLPSGKIVTEAGVYADTIKYAAGCDSLVKKLTVNILPRPNLGRDTTVCLAQNAYVLNATSTGALSYLWQDGSNNPIFNATTSGLYWVQVNYGTCSTRDSVNIGVYPQPATTVLDTAICEGQSLLLPWGITVTAAGSYTDTIRAGTGCDSLVQIVNLVINNKPAAGKDTSITVCSNLAFNLATLYNTSGYTAQWEFNGSPVGSPEAVTQSGIYKLVLTSNQGCSDTAEALLTVNPKPELGNDTSISTCSDAAVNLNTLYHSTGFTTAWSSNNIPVVNPAAVNTTGIYQLVASANGCSDTAVVTLTVYSKPLLGNDTSLTKCIGDAVALSALYNTSGLSASWYLNNNAVINPSVIVSSGSYTLIASNNDGCSDTAFATVSFNSKPALGNDTAISRCSGTTINLNTLYNTTGLNSSWSLNGNTVANPATVNSSGSYLLTAINNNGCSDTALAVFTILPKPVLGRDTLVAICSGTIFNLTTLYNLQSNETALWTLGNNTVLTPSAVTAAGTYSIVVTNLSGCTDTAFATIQVTPGPQLGSDTTITICEGSTFNLSTLYNINGNTNVWQLNNTTVNNPAAVNTSGTYMLNSTTTAGCSAQVQVTLVVNSLPVVVVNNPPLICAPQTVDLTASAITAGSTPGLIFSYWADAAATIAVNNPAAVNEGLWYIKGTTATGCSNTSTVQVQYYALPTVNAGNDIAICQQGETLLQATVSNTTAPVTYAWEPVTAGGIVSPATATTIVKPQSTQQYILTVTDGYGCNYTIKDTVLVTVQPPVPAFAGNDTIAVIGVPQQLQASGGVFYSWSPPGLLDNPNIANPKAILSGDAQFSVEVKDAVGCIGYDTVIIKTFADIRFYVPNAFSPNGDGLNDVFRPVASGIPVLEWFRIANRYGEIVFETNQLNKGWDGTFRNKPQATGNYVWWLRGKTSSGRIVEMKGNVVLVR
ncbi:MAG TPA: gliding motility-associated C-terminal domain-containing protein [Ferruginibacter sp.]|nr:gliding motility-associated C-terminal domain-containing protein [Ferruginibacter sp.]HMP20647.1 gliding motility-associated C-terminal domain-containing protein [Ferruginibacter sp.]